MRISLVEPDTRGIHIFKGFRLPRLGTVLLATLMGEKGHDCEVQVEVAAPIDMGPLLRADLVGISTLTPTATRAYEVADAVRAAGVPVVLGGPHVTFMTDEALEHADYVVRGEGEVALASLVAALEAGATDEGLDGVPNLSWRRGDGRITHNPMAPPVHMDSLPEPDWSLVRAGVDPSGRMSRKTVPVQTSRGCPYACTFCSVTEVFGRRMRYRSVPSVIDGLRRHDRRGNLIFFYDDNFAASPDRVTEICEGMLSAGFKRLVWSAQVRADVARDPKLLRLMKRAGAHTVYVGLESAHEESLAAMRKKQSVQAMREHMRAFNEVGIRVHGMFVLGFDQDTPESVAATLRFAMEERLSSAQFLLIIPLPGTPTYDELKAQGRLVLHDWDLYDGHHVVIRPSRFGMRELQQAQLDAHATFYSRRRQIGWLSRGKIVETMLNGYARRLNHTWQRRNTDFLELLERLDLEHATAGGPSLPLRAA